MFESNRACAHTSEAAGPAVRSFTSPRLAVAGLAAFLVVGLPGTAFASPPDHAWESICTNSGNGGPNNGQGLGNMGLEGSDVAAGDTVRAGNNPNAATVECAPVGNTDADVTNTTGTVIDTDTIDTDTTGTVIDIDTDTTGTVIDTITGGTGTGSTGTGGTGTGSRGIGGRGIGGTGIGGTGIGGTGGTGTGGTGTGTNTDGTDTTGSGNAPVGGGGDTGNGAVVTIPGGEGGGAVVETPAPVQEPRGAVVSVPTGEEPELVLPTPRNTHVDPPVVHRPTKQVVEAAPAGVESPAQNGPVDEILGGQGANRPAAVIAPAALAPAALAPAAAAPAAAAPATAVLPATGAGDDLGLLAVTGLGMLLAGVASLVGRRRVTTG